MFTLSLGMEALLIHLPFNMVYRHSEVAGNCFLSESSHYSWGIVREKNIYQKERINIYLNLSRENWLILW